MKKIRENRYSKLVGASERQYYTDACLVCSFSLSFCPCVKTQQCANTKYKEVRRVGNRGNSDKSLNISSKYYARYTANWLVYYQDLTRKNKATVQTYLKTKKLKRSGRIRAKKGIKPSEHRLRTSTVCLYMLLD